MKSLDFQLSWPQVAAQTANAADATFADLRLFVGGENATSYINQATEAEIDHVDQPMLYLAEWVVENWWSLLWEPEKTEDPVRKNDGGFLLRHSLMGAERGFLLPDVRFTPTGANIQVFSKPRAAEHADVRFTRHVKTVAQRSEIEHELSGFVEKVLARLPTGVGGELREDWSLVRDVDGVAAVFCKLMGAMGLSPYQPHPRIEAALDTASATLSGEELFDLCQTATAEDFVRSVKVAGLVNDLLESDPASGVNLRPLASVVAPGDHLSAPAFRRGLSAARELRSAFNISNGDLLGANRIFECLELDYRAGRAISLKGVASPLSGATARTDGDHGKLAIVHQAQSSRRFAAARGAYFLWTGNRAERRLLTNAVTRSQQASRAFAAELLIPQEIVRSHSARSRLSWDQVNAIAEEAMVAPDVVRHQATNCGLQIVQ